MAQSLNQDNDTALILEIFEKLPSAIIVLDPKGYIKKANKPAHSLLSQDKLEGRSWLEVIKAVFRPKPDDGHEISTVDGKRLQVSTLPLSYGQLVQMTDLSETRRMQDKISHMERLSSLGKMAASLAHQIRTPLSAAILYAANLANQNLPLTAKQNFQKKLMSRLEALEAQVSDILMFARSGQQTVSALDAVDLIEQTCANVASTVEKNGVNLLTQIGPKPMTILANEVALCGAVSNLVSNAIEAGAKNVMIKLYSDDQNIMIAVGNDGPQIDPDIKNKIFEPFFTSKSNGTGLGLAVVQAVAKVHQGKVTLSSWDDNYKTVFIISIPRFNKNLEQNIA